MKTFAYTVILIIAIISSVWLLAFQPELATKDSSGSQIPPSETTLLRAELAREEARMSDADSLFGQTLSILQEHPNPNIESRARLEYSSLLIELGRFDDAVNMITPSIVSDQFNIFSPPQLVTMSCIEAEAHIRGGNYSLAEKKISECKRLEKRLEARSPELQAFQEHLTGFFHHVQGHYSLALDHYQLALTIRRNMFGVESTQYSNTLNNIANVHWRLGQYSKSVKYHKEVLLIREGLFGEVHHKIAGSLGNLGNLYAAKGDFAKALDYHFNAASIWNELFSGNHPELSYTYDNIGYAYNSLHDYANAHIYLSQALRIKKTSLGTDHPFYATTLFSHAVTLLNLGRQELALKSVKHAIDIYQQNDLFHHPKYQKAQGILARILFNMGESSNAISTLNAAIAESSKLDQPYTIHLLNDLAQFYLTMGENSQALENIQAALNLNVGVAATSTISTNPPPDLEKDLPQLLRSFQIKAAAYKSLFRHSSEVDDLNSSLKALERALAVAAFSRQSRTSSSSKNEISRMISSIAQQAIKLAIQLYRLNNDSRVLERAYMISDQYKSGQLLDALFESDARTFGSVPESLRLEEQKIRMKITSLERALSNQSLAKTIRQPDSSETLRQSLFNEKKRFATIIELMENSYPKYYMLKHGVKHATVLSLQNNLLLDDTSLIEYVDIDTDIYAFIVNNDGIYFRHISDHDTLNNAVIELNKADSTRISRKILSSSHAIYTIVIESLYDVIKDDNLVIIPNPILSSISFEALITDPLNSRESPIIYSQYPYMIHDRMISYGLSASLLLQQVENSKVEFRKDILAFAPVFDGSVSFSQDVTDFLKTTLGTRAPDPPRLARLMGSAREVNKISKIMKRKNGWLASWTSKESDILLRRRSTEHQLKTLNLNDYRYIHFATHSFANQDDPASSGIILETNGTNGEDGILYASEVFGLDLSAELVVLSSCDTAKSSESDSGGLAGFARGFIYAGAQNLVASLWPSDDVGASILMEQFYKELADGHPIDKALRTAKLKLINSGGPIAKPYYWSGFIHIGAPSKGESPVYASN